MHALKDPQGRFVTSPDGIDALLRQAWDAIYAGNVSNVAQHVAHYITKYANYLYRSTTHHLAPLTGRDLQLEILHTANSSPGLDLWTYNDLKLLPLEAFDMLAQLLNSIEQGCPWPNQLLYTKAHLLAKNPDKRLDPLQYRCLTITPVVYRAWAKVRLKHMEAWIAGWAHSQMYAGIAGRGASDAWYLSSMEVELAKLEHTPIVGGALDLFKCFDQIVRQLLYVILALAGCPHQVLVPYIAYQENCVVMNSFAGALGQPHRRQCGIPQGCPLSMAFIALLTRPWILQMEAMGAMARVLADDILLLTK